VCFQTEREVAIFFKSDKLEDAHEILTDGEVFEPGSQFTWTLSSAIVNPIIAVGRGSHLTEPAKHYDLWSVDRDAAIERVVRFVNKTVTRKNAPSFLRRCSPCFAYR